MIARIDGIDRRVEAGALTDPIGENIGMSSLPLGHFSVAMRVPLVLWDYFMSFSFLTLLIDAASLFLKSGNAINIFTVL